MEILIVGCGRMGSWFAAHLKKSGYRVYLYDKSLKKAKALAERLGCSYLPSLRLSRSPSVLVAVPIANYPEVFEKLTSLDFKPKWVLEIASFKQPIMRVLRYVRNSGIEVVSIHPLFGPETKTLRGTVTAHVEPSRRKKERAIINSILRGTKIIEVDAATHDKVMYFALSLPHLIGLSYAMTLRRAPNITRKLLTNSMRQLIALSMISVKESPTFYNKETFLNKDCLSVYEEFQRNLLSIINAITKGEPFLKDVFSNIRPYFAAGRRQ